MNIYLIIFTISILLSAFFSAAETAFTSLSDLQIQLIRAKHTFLGTIIYYLQKHSDILISTILIGNNAANISFSVTAAHLTTELFGSRLLALMTGGITLFMLIFCEITPKQLAMQNNQKFMTVFAFPLIIFFICFMPIAHILSLCTNMFSNILFLKKTKDITDGLSRKNLVTLFYQARTSGILHTNNVHMITRILNLSSFPIENVMTHRTDIVSFSSVMTIKEAVQTIKECGYTIFPVYEQNNIEQIIGIVYAIDLLTESDTSLLIQTKMKKVLFIPETKNIEEAIDIFKAKNNTFAVIIDEYGGLTGIVTLKDITLHILNIASDIHKNTVADVPLFIPLDDINFLVEGEMPITRVEEIAGIYLDFIPESHTPESHTIAGYISELTGNLPEQDNIINTIFGTFRVLRIKDNRIISVLWTRDDAHYQRSDSNRHEVTLTRF